MKHDWSEEYDHLLERAIAEGKVQVLPGEEERRGSPRFRLAEELIRSGYSIQRDLIDVSNTGFAFHSERAYEVGEPAPLTMHKVFEALATVVGCETVESGSDTLDSRYRVRCQFTDPEHGMILIMMLFEDPSTTGQKEAR